jgi:lipoprotein-releasing system permease protein
LKLPFFIAKRYFFSLKNTTAINLITGISVVGYAAGSFFLIVILSALNGFEKIIFQVYDTYYPDLKIEIAEGKVFEEDSQMMQRILKTPGVIAASFCLEENAIVQSAETQIVASVKGVDAAYFKVINTDSLIVSGDARLEDKQGALGWMAEGLIYKLNVGRQSNKVTVTVPDRESASVTQMATIEDELRITAMIRPGDEMNQKLIIAPLPWAKEMFNREGQVSSIEIKVKDPLNPEKVAAYIKSWLGNKYTVHDRREQNKSVYKMFRSEKWIVFAIIAFALLLITFNLIGSLSMLVLEKKKDIQLLSAVGMESNKIKRIFFTEGVLVALTGTIIGLAIGIFFVWLQTEYGFITTHSTFVVAYPMQLRIADIILVLGLGSLLGISGAIYPAAKSTPKMYTSQ